MIYGYSKSVIDEKYGLLEMKEVSFEFKAADLRRLAEFLREAADKLESGQLRSSHLHMSAVDPNWTSDFPDCDIIVINPSPAAPKEVG